MSTAPTHARKRASQRPAAVPKADLKAVKGTKHRLLRWSTVLISALFLILLFGLVAFNALIVRNQGQLDGIDADIAEAEHANQRLRFEIAELEAPERIRQLAVSTLGMIPPETVIYLEPINADLLGDDS